MVIGMSVEYRSGLAKGWIIKEADINRIPEEDAEELMNYGDLFCLNSWCGGDYILAIESRFCSEGSVLDVGDIDWGDETNNPAAIALRKFFPERADEKPNLWLFTEVY